MDIRIKATNTNLTQGITDYVEKRLSAFEKYIDPKDTSVKCYVEVGRTTKHHKHGDILRAEINLHISGQDFRSVSETSSLHGAIDEAKDEMVRTLRKHKQKQSQQVKRGGAQMKSFIKKHPKRFRK